MKLSPKEAMQLAIAEGRKGAGFVSPNPLVGCVILDKNLNLLATGYHAKVGDLHAETHALKAVNDVHSLEGAHFFVTLEPCAHQGRQPSCAKALAALPIASVTYGLVDPNPKVAGKGSAIVAAAGIRVEQVQDPELLNELEELAEIFLLNMRQKRPFVALKVASSLDGQVALKSGESQWITGPESRDLVQSLRGQYDCLLTGVGTVLSDDPRLNSRDPKYKDKAQKLVILDPHGRLIENLKNLNLAKVRELKDIFLVTAETVLPQAACNHLRLPLNDGKFALDRVLALLFEREISSIFVEAGATTCSSFLRSNFVDKIYLFMSTKILGDGIGWTKGLDFPNLDAAIVLKDVRMQTIGQDFLLSGRPEVAQPKS